jgi:hypothetical protein
VVRRLTVAGTGDDAKFKPADQEVSLQLPV